MVSKASDDLTEPDSPVKTMSLSRGRSIETLRRLCSRAPRITRESAIGRSAYRFCLPDVPTSGRAGALLDLLELPTQVLDLVTEARCVLEAQIGRRFGHLLLQGVDEP